MMWKILTTYIREEIYYSPECRGLFLQEQKKYKRTKGTDDLLYRLAHLRRDQNQGEKCSHCMD